MLPFTTLCETCYGDALPNSKHCARHQEPHTPTSPAHYKMVLPSGASIEALDIIEAKGWFPAYCKGNILKYLLRADQKGNELQDLQKAATYLNKLIEFLKDTGQQ